MKLKDSAGWDKFKEMNTDPYGKGMLDFGERWANMMEAQMTDGGKLADIAKSTSHEADTDGITWFMYGAALSMLSQVWKHGEELRTWHTLDIQIKDEGVRANESGGVLNPAIININV